MRRLESEFQKHDVTKKLIETFKHLMSERSLTSGQRLPPERELAKSLGVARSSLRQALKVLEIMGVISQRVGDGTYVNNDAAFILSEPMEFLILLDGITFHELMEARLIVEPELAARAASRATDDDLRTLRQSLAGMKEGRRNHRCLIEQDLLFHYTIFRVAGNRVCSRMFSTIHRSLQELIQLTSQLVELEHTLSFHNAIYTAIRRRDPEEARRHMLEHLTDAKGLLARAHERKSRSRLEGRIATLAVQLKRESKRASQLPNE